MKTLQIIAIAITMLNTIFAHSQVLGVGTITPSEKMDINGKLKTNTLILNYGGNPYEFLMKNTVAGEVGFRKAQGGQGLNYIICIAGSWPSEGGPLVETPLLGEVQLFAGNFAPSGWALCQGQLMSITLNTALFSILGTSYGGNGITTFGLPDLRCCTAVGVGIASPAGYNWDMGERWY